MRNETSRISGLFTPFTMIRSIVILVLSITTLALAEQPGVVSSEFIFETAPHPQCHARTLVETEGGLVAAWFGGTKEGHPDVGIWLSRHREG